MKEEKKFVCSYCDKEFSDKRKCEEHEKNHKYPTGILCIDYMDSEKYPKIMQVLFNDGTTEDYVINGSQVISNVYKKARKNRGGYIESIKDTIIWKKLKRIVLRSEVKSFFDWNRSKIELTTEQKEGIYNLIKEGWELIINRGDTVTVTNDPFALRNGINIVTHSGNYFKYDVRENKLFNFLDINEWYSLDSLLPYDEYREKMWDDFMQQKLN